MFPVRITGPVIATPPAMPDAWVSLHEAVSAFKRRFILDVLSHFDGNRSRTAAALGRRLAVVLAQRVAAAAQRRPLASSAPPCFASYAISASPRCRALSEADRAPQGAITNP